MAATKVKPVGAAQKKAVGYIQNPGKKIFFISV